MQIEVISPEFGRIVLEAATKKEMILKLLKITFKDKRCFSYGSIAKSVGCSAPYVYYVDKPDKKRENMRQFYRRNPESMKASKRRYEIKKGIYKGVRHAQSQILPGQDQGISGNGGCS